MIASAWQWAASHNLLRVNKIHKEEEARLVLTDTFELCDETGTQISMDGSIEVQASILIRPLSTKLSP